MLTNQLKVSECSTKSLRDKCHGRECLNSVCVQEWISYRQLNVAEETAVMAECKEDACFVSMDFDRDVALTRCVNR